MKLLFCPQCGEKLVSQKENETVRLYCKTCNEFIYENPVPVVAGIILDRENKILLIKRGVKPCIGKWTLPTGFIEVNETSEKCIVREIKEETNLDCRIKELLGVYQQKGWRYKSVIVLAYVLDVIKGEAKAGDDAIDICYFNFIDLPKIPFKSHREIIRDIYKGKSNILQ